MRPVTLDQVVETLRAWVDALDEADSHTLIQAGATLDEARGMIEAVMPLLSGAARMRLPRPLPLRSTGLKCSRGGDSHHAAVLYDGVRELLCEACAAQAFPWGHP